MDNRTPAEKLTDALNSIPRSDRPTVIYMMDLFNALTARARARWLNAAPPTLSVVSRGKHCTFTFLSDGRGFLAEDSNHKNRAHFDVRALSGWLFRALRDEVAIERPDGTAVPAHTVSIIVEMEEA